MFSRFAALLMCFAPLACPALAGRCCEPSEGCFATTPARVHDCCNADQHDHHAPAEHPEPCRDCFCAGALPPAVDMVKVPDDSALNGCVLDAFVLQTDGGLLDASRLPDSWRAKPPSGRVYLTSLCSLLL